MAAAPLPHGVTPSEMDVGTRLARLERDVETLKERVQHLDGLTAAGAVVTPVSIIDPLWLQSRARGGVARVVTELGRALIAVGVAYLLRAIVDADLLAPPVGVLTGLVYAVAWLGVSFVAAKRGDALGAAFANALTPVLACPLILEAALRFEVWSATQALLALGAVTVAAMLTAAVNRLQSVAWVTAAGATVSAAVLTVALGAYIGGEVLFVALGVGTLWLGYVRDWTMLRWPAALLADVGAAALVLRALDADAGESPYAVMWVLLLLMSAYPLSIIVRTVVLNRDVVIFEIVQSIALLLLLRGALALAPLTGSAAPLLGSAVLGLGVVVSAAAATFAHGRRARSPNVRFYASVGTVLLMVGGAILLDGVPLAAYWILLTCAFAGAALYLRRGERGELMVHATLLAIAAAWPSQLGAYSTRALLGETSMLGAPHPAAIAACGVLAALAWTAMALDDPDSIALRRTTMLVSSVAVLATAAGLTAGLVTLLATTAFGAVTPSTVAMIRTLTLSSAAWLAAVVGRVPRFAIAGWLSYAVLLLIAIKLVAEDLRTGTPLERFVALAAYGAALIVSARLRRPPD
jgi:hypothetical protein